MPKTIFTTVYQFQELSDAAKEKARSWYRKAALHGWAEAREEGQGHVSAGLAALRAVAGWQATEVDQDEIKQRLSRIAGRDLGADGTGHEAGADAIRDRLKQVLGRDKPDPRQEQQRKLEEEREKQRQLELEWQHERDRDLGWEL